MSFEEGSRVKTKKTAGEGLANKSGTVLSIHEALFRSGKGADMESAWIIRLDQPYGVLSTVGLPGSLLDPA